MRPFETLSRRGLLLTLGAGGALAGSGRQALADPVFAEYPFQLGIAAGDPTPDGFVIWTRLAPRPMEIGHGMPSAPVPVKWEVATSRGFGDTVVRSGETVARPELAHAVHVEVEGLEPGRDYFYRFNAGRERTPSGRARTAPAAGSAKSINGSFTGPSVFVNYGNVQVKITVVNGRITDAVAVVAPSGRNDRWTNMAVPILKQQTLAAQSANIQGASGASYTSYGWYTSLQGALAQAGL